MKFPSDQYNFKEGTCKHLPMLIAALERGKLNIDMEEVR